MPRFIKLTGIHNHAVIINADDIQDVRRWPGPTTAAVITHRERYLVQESVNQIGEKLNAVGKVV
jgi:uncharacterized protein YlzI (FlbEa/FlbD family)